MNRKDKRTQLGRIKVTSDFPFNEAVNSEPAPSCSNIPAVEPVVNPATDEAPNEVRGKYLFVFRIIYLVCLPIRRMNFLKSV